MTLPVKSKSKGVQKRHDRLIRTRFGYKKIIVNPKIIKPKWVRVQSTSEFKVINPATRITIEITRDDISKSYHIYVYRSYKTSPAKGEKRPFWSRIFDKVEDVIQERNRIMALPLSRIFTILFQEEKQRIRKNFQKYLDWADEFFRNTALFAPHTEKYTYYREGVIIKVKIQPEEGSLGGAFIVLTGDNYPKLKSGNKRPIIRKVWLGFIGSGHDPFDKDYFLNGWPPFLSNERTQREEQNKILIKEGKKPIPITIGFDEAARDVFHFTRALGWVEDALHQVLKKPTRGLRPDEVDDDDITG